MTGSPSRAKIPPKPAAAPTHQPLDEEALQKDRDRRRQLLAAAGRGGTILTGGGLGTSTGQQTLLGGKLS